MNPQDPMAGPQQSVYGAQPGQDIQPANNPTIPPADTMFQPIASPSPQSFDASIVQPTNATQNTNPTGFPSNNQPFQSPQPMTKLPTPPKKSSVKKPLIIALIMMAVLGSVTAAVIMFGVSKNQTPVATEQTEQPQGPQPAQAIDVEQTNNSINQDVTGFDNTKDFPDNMLEDAQLGL